MTELALTLKDTIDERFPAPPVEQLRARAIRVRRKRRLGWAGGAVAVGIVVVVAGYAVNRADHSATIHAATPGSTHDSFVATEVGGYSGSGAWLITIERDGELIEFDSASSPACGPTGTIRPGDVVMVSIGDSTSTIGVGEGFDCDS